jgi:alkylated DNA nucleotide flippase Atl1
MVSTRAADVAEVLWELKRAGKLQDYSTVAKRAGFSAGANGRAMITCLKTVRRDWPHLQWWRAIKDDGVIEESEQAELLRENGFEVGEQKDGTLVMTLEDDHRMVWADEEAVQEQPES